LGMALAQEYYTIVDYVSIKRPAQTRPPSHS
jgi:hypothetical protein